MEEEISLRELIEILLKGKKIIAAITIVAILMTGVVNFFVLAPIYESKSILMASGISATVQAEDIKGVESLLNSISPYPQMSVEAYKEQIKNPQILDEVITELDLGSRDINRVGLRNMLTLSTIDKTNLITITVQNPDPKLAADIANAVTKKFMVHVSGISKDQAEKSSNYLKTQMEVEKEKMAAALLEYKAYMSQPKSLNELEKEVESKTTLITTYKEELLNTGIKEKMLVASLENAQQELAQTSEKIVLKKSLLDDPIMSEYVKEQTEQPAGGLYNMGIQTEEVNEAYIYLINLINNMEIELAQVRAQKLELDKAISKTRKELEGLNAELAEKQHQDETITQKVDFAQSTYEAFLNKYEETRILQSSDIGEASITIVSPAVESLSPVGPRKMLNVAIAGVLGAMASVFFVFFKAYWNASGNTIGK